MRCHTAVAAFCGNADIDVYDAPGWRCRTCGFVMPAGSAAVCVAVVCRRRWIRSTSKFAVAVSRFALAFLRRQASYLTGFAYRRRVAICRRCPLRSGNRCTSCGCYIRGILGKARLSTEHCPRGKWPGDDPVKPCGCGG